MVQVDIFWSYGIGATFAVAASRQLRALERAPQKDVPEPKRGPFDAPYFLKTVLFLALLFAPSGLYLVWAFPSWETMHVGDKDMPAWLVTLFAITNVTQGILGYWVAYRLIIKDRFYAAYLTIVAAYFAMFFILVHGWDGTGYQRFFSATRDDFLHWGAKPWSAWLTSDVAIALMVMGVFLLPVMFRWISSWIREGYALEDRSKNLVAPNRHLITALFLASVLGAGLGSAILASVLIHQLGLVLGVLVFAASTYAIAVHRKSVCALLYRRMFEAGASVTPARKTDTPPTSSPAAQRG
jgi:hypothetical protein